MMRIRSLLTALCSLSILLGTVCLTGCGDSATETTASTAEASPSTSAQVAPADPLAFPVGDYTVETGTIETAEGKKEVTFHSYQKLTYVVDPIDSDFQSLNVAVPVEIDGVAIDASDAPILFELAVGGYMPVRTSAKSTVHPALAAGYVVVSPGCRGSSNEDSDGTFYGKAPAAIVDLKCAVKYIRYNDAVLPGNADWIITTGTSAGGALSALLGTSGGQDAYETYFDELGAADASDAVYACACYCPITDLNHADMAYESEFGHTPLDSDGSRVDRRLSARLAAEFDDYLESLGLQGRNGFGPLTKKNYGEYLLQDYLIPSANDYLSSLSDTDREAYLDENTWIKWADGEARFDGDDYVAHVGRMKGLPAFDTFDLSSPECRLFGDETTDTRHFTDFSLQQTTGDDTATVDPMLQEVVDLMNPVYFLGQEDSSCADYWWLRQGTKDTDTAGTVILNLATSLENRGKDVNTRLYWDAGHGANEDPYDFITWIGTITGYAR